MLLGRYQRLKPVFFAVQESSTREAMTSNEIQAVAMFDPLKKHLPAILKIGNRRFAKKQYSYVQ